MRHLMQQECSIPSHVETTHVSLSGNLSKTRVDCITIKGFSNFCGDADLILMSNVEN